MARDERPKCPEGKFKYCPQSKECNLWREFLVSQRIANDDLTAPANVATVTKGDCSHNWTAIFLYDLNFKTLGVQAATESFRNEVVDGNQNLIMSLAAVGQQARQISLQREEAKQLVKEKEDAKRITKEI